MQLVEPLPAEIHPPFDLTADMLFVAGLAPTQPLRRSFPGVPFLSLFGRTPLALWFSRVTEGCYRDERGDSHCLGGPEDTLYNEVTILAVLRKRALFCPVIYASNDLSIPIAKMYGMPKEVAPIALWFSGRDIKSQLSRGQLQSAVDASQATRGTLASALLSRLWPVWSWPVHFPARTHIEALVQATPKARLAAIRQGTLKLHASWLPSAVSFMRFGLFVPQLRMQLPPPP